MFKMKSPEFLKRGDQIGIVASARSISKSEISDAVIKIKSNGFEPVFDKNLFFVNNQFAGDDIHRASELQNMLDNERIRAIFFARGGYGSIKIVDKLDFTQFCKNPKWLVGYSDITVFLNHVSNVYDVITVHGTMPINYPSNSSASINEMFKILKGEKTTIKFDKHPLNRPGNLNGEIVGGNLSVLYSMLGSLSFPLTDGKILFIEDLDEYLYHIDRMMMGLKRAGVFDGLKGIIVGAMTKMNDNLIPFGSTAYQTIRSITDEFEFPLYFGLPVGHIANNLPLCFGKKAIIYAEDKNLVLSYC
jgi:muramoyltetrapeptide carboxypeptidase